MASFGPVSFRPRLLELFRRPREPVAWGTEILAGATVGVIALPLALALGIASLPPGLETPYPAPALGIFTAIIAGFIISALGGSRVQIGGPTAAFIPIVLLIAGKHGYGGLVIATMMAGVILILMGVCGMGKLIKYIPWPVTSGFTTGIAIAIMLTQVATFTGMEPSVPAPGEFVEKLEWLWHEAGTWNPHSLLVALIALGILIAWPRLRWRRIPGSLVAVAVATIMVAILGWGDAHGVATVGSQFGPDALPATLPRPHWPDLNWATVRDLIGPATAIAVLGAIESLLSAVVADGLSGDRHDSNTELIAQGIANVICPFFGGLPATGAIARTSANVGNGGRTPVAGMVHALTLLLIVLLASRLATYIPLAAMSAVLVMIAVRMGEWHELRRVTKMTHSDALVLVTTTTLTVVFDLVVAIEVGMVLAAILFIRRVSETTEVSRVTTEDVLEAPEHVAQGKEIPPGVVVYRIFGPFLFGAAEKMEDALARSEQWPKVLILRLNLVTAMDATGLHALESIVERMRSRKGVVILSGIHRQPLEMIRKADFIPVIGRPNFCGTFDEALQRSRAVLAEAKPSQ